MIPKSWWWAGLVGLIILAALPFAGHRIRGDRLARCAWDGLELQPIYQVRIVETPESDYLFCCLQCAESWLARRGRSSVRVFVTDEASGREFVPSAAYYVRSSVVTNQVTGERRHVFRREQDAAKHAEAARGRHLVGAERPFAKISDIESEDGVDGPPSNR